MEIQSEPTVPPAPATLPDYVSVPFQPLHAKLFKRVFKLILEKGLFFNGEQQRRESPYQFKNPDQLKSEFNFALTQDGNSQETVLEALEKVIRFSPHLSHTFYLDKRRTGVEPYSIIGDFVATVMSTAVVTYFVAPVFTLAEEEVKREVRKLVGYPEIEGDGLICPGSGFATSLALRLCLQKFYPDLRSKGFIGIGKPKFCVFQSEHGGTSLKKACMVLGLGTENLIRVKADSLGRMDVAELKIAYKKAKAANLTPIFVEATAGTQLLGAIDPIDEMANFCAKKKLWLHVCGDYGGAYLLYSEGKGRLKGIEKSDSFEWSPTEMLGIPYCITVLVTKYEKLCKEAFDYGAEYLFEPNDLYDTTFDNGDGTIQTSRRPEIFKFWFKWKVKVRVTRILKFHAVLYEHRYKVPLIFSLQGKTAIGAHVKYCDDLAKFAVTEILKRQDHLKLILPKYDTTRVAFQFTRHKPFHGFCVGELNRKLKEELLTRGKMVVGLSQLPGQPYFLTISFTNSALSRDDIAYILDEIIYVGKKLTNPLFDPVGRLEPKVPKPLSSYPEYVSIPIENLHKSLFKKTLDLITAKGLYFQNKRSETCYNFRKPEVLLTEFDFELADEPVQSEDQIINILEQTIFYSIHQSHPYYVYQLLSGGLDPYGIIGDIMTSAITTNMLTYEDAPVYTLMEAELFKASRRRLGYPGKGDGMLCPGGSISVISALHVAKVAKYPNIRTQGLTIQAPKKLVVYISINAHYCTNKGCALQGIGLDNCVKVDVDDRGRMSVQALRLAIKNTLNEGGTPFFVVATAGTTVLGAADPINDIADVCAQYDIWLHVDGSIGGSLIMSEKYKALYLSGAERSDSFNYNPHKMYGVAEETSIVLFRRKGVVKVAFGFNDPFGTPKSTLYNSNKYDKNGAQGGLQYSRRPNALKFWLLWKKKGYEDMGKEVEYMYELKNFTLQELSRRKDRFISILPDYDMPNVCFYYVPKSLRGLDRNSQEFKDRVNKVGGSIKIKISLPLASKITLAGHILTGVLADPKFNQFLKFVLFNSGVTFDDIKYMLDEIDFQGNDVAA